MVFLQKQSPRDEVTNLSDLIARPWTEQEKEDFSEQYEAWRLFVFGMFGYEQFFIL